MGIMRKLEVIYVENDPALRGLISSTLRKHPEVAEVAEFSTGEEAVAFARARRMNVALIDLSLGFGQLDGIATGNELRRLNENIGIVIFSQHAIDEVSRLVDFGKREAWSYFPKRANLEIDELVEVLKFSSLGRSVVEGINQGLATSQVSSTAFDLTKRQHVVLSLLATGMEPKFIAEQLNISFDSVRKDLSLAYSSLVPNPKPGTDLRVSAILKYQRLMGSPSSYAD
jgi:DNA-binding NarL/FixJ family response regulator